MSEAAIEPAVDTVEPVAAEPVEPAAAGDGGGAPEWISSPEFQQAVRDAAAAEAEAIAGAQFGGLLEELQRIAAAEDPAVGHTAAGTPTLDPYSDSFGTDLATFVQQQNQQLLGEVKQMFEQFQQPFLARAEQETVAEGEARIKDMIADDIARNGDLPETAKQMIRTLASDYFAEAEARYGKTARAAEHAIGRAAQVVRGLVNESRQAAADAEANRTATLAGAPNEPAGTGASGVVTFPEGKPMSNLELAAKYATRAQAVRGGAAT